MCLRSKRLAIKPSVQARQCQNGNLPKRESWRWTGRISGRWFHMFPFSPRSPPCCKRRQISGQIWQRYTAGVILKFPRHSRHTQLVIRSFLTRKCVGEDKGDSCGDLYNVCSAYKNSFLIAGVILVPILNPRIDANAEPILFWQQKCAKSTQ